MAQAGINPDGTLAGKVAVITGASRGIGAAISTRLAMEGAKVVATARTAEEGESRLSGTLNETVNRIRSGGGEAMFIKADLAQPADRERLIEETVAAYGPVDILVNNAAVVYSVPFLDFTPKRFDLMMQVLVYAPFHLSQLVVPGMREKQVDRQHLLARLLPSEAATARQGLHRLRHVQDRPGAVLHGPGQRALRRQHRRELHLARPRRDAGNGHEQAHQRPVPQHRRANRIHH